MRWRFLSRVDGIKIVKVIAFLGSTVVVRIVGVKVTRPRKMACVLMKAVYCGIKPKDLGSWIFGCKGDYRPLNSRHKSCLVFQNKVD